MVAETSEASKDQQSESENNRFANLSGEQDLERILEDNQTRPRTSTLTGVFPRSRASFKLK